MNEISFLFYTLIFMKRSLNEESKDDELKKQILKKRKEEILNQNSDLINAARDRVNKNMLIKTSYQLALENTLSIIMRNCSLFDERIIQIIIVYIPIIFWDNEAELNKINQYHYETELFINDLLVEKRNLSGFVLNFREKMIVFDFKNDHYEFSRFDTFKSIVLINSVNSLTIEYELETSKLYLRSMTKKMNGKNILISDYISLMMDVCNNIHRFFAKERNILLINNVSIKSIDISPSLDVVICINIDYQYHLI